MTESVQTTVSVVSSAWPIFVTGLLAFAWFIRLESKVLYMEKDQEKEQKKRDLHDATIWEKFDAVQKTMNDVLVKLGELSGAINRPRNGDRERDL